MEQRADRDAQAVAASELARFSEAPSHEQFFGSHVNPRRPCLLRGLFPAGLVELDEELRGLPLETGGAVTTLGEALARQGAAEEEPEAAGQALLSFEGPARRLVEGFQPFAFLSPVPLRTRHLTLSWGGPPGRLGVEYADALYGSLSERQEVLLVGPRAPRELVGCDAFLEAPKLPLLRCVLEPGDLLFVPALWLRQLRAVPVGVRILWQTPLACRRIQAPPPGRRTRKKKTWERKIEALKRRVRPHMHPDDWGLGQMADDTLIEDLSRYTIPPQAGIDRVQARELPPQRFESEYELVARPVMIEGLTDDWPARRRWTFPELRRRYGRLKFAVAESPAGVCVLKLKHFLRYMEAQRDDDPIKVFCNHFPRLGGGALLQDYDVPELFRADVYPLAGFGERPPFRWFIIGPRRSGTSVHVDPGGTSAWNALLQGRKHWVLLPPDTDPELLQVSFILGPNDGDFAALWFQKVLPRLRRRAPQLREIVQEPGDTIFVPGGWWHAVLNLEDTVSITQNYIHPRNLARAWEQCRPDRHRTVRDLLASERVRRSTPALVCESLGIDFDRLAWSGLAFLDAYIAGGKPPAPVAPAPGPSLGLVGIARQLERHFAGAQEAASAPARTSSEVAPAPAAAPPSARPELPLATAEVVETRDGVTLKRVFGEYFVEARPPGEEEEIAGWIAELVGELQRRRREGAFQDTTATARVVDTTGIAATLLDSGHVVHEWDHPALKRLLAWACECAAVLARAYGYEAPQPEVDSAWAHITPTGGSMAYHTHGGGPRVQSAASVFYLQLEPPPPAEPTSGCVLYRSPRGEAEHLIEPRVGLLTIWPGHVPHRVLPYSGHAERMIIGINVAFERAALEPKRPPERLIQELARRSGLHPRMFRRLDPSSRLP